MIVLFAAQTGLPAASAAQATVSAAPADKDALGLRLARTGPLAAMAPALIEKDLAELAQEDASLTAAQRQRLMEIGKAEGQRGLDRVFAAIGREYAARLSEDDLRQLVAFNESESAKRWRAAEPAVVMGAMQTLGQLDFKKAVAAEFCRDSGKLCGRK